MAVGRRPSTEFLMCGGWVETAIILLLLLYVYLKSNTPATPICLHIIPHFVNKNTVGVQQNKALVLNLGPIIWPPAWKNNHMHVELRYAWSNCKSSFISNIDFMCMRVPLQHGFLCFFVFLFLALWPAAKPTLSFSPYVIVCLLCVHSPLVF